MYELVTMVTGRYSVNESKQFGGGDFFINGNIIRHLKLEISSAIAASNDEK